MFPIILAGAAVAAIFLSGCSKDDEDDSESKSKTENNSSKITYDVSYQKKCINDTGCSDAQRIAAAYDYIGAVYGEKNKVAYDNILTVQERVYVEKTFGSIVKPEAIPNLLYKAQQNYFEDNSAPQKSLYCRDASLWHFLKGTDSLYGKFTAIFGAHNCGRQFGELFIHSQLEQEIAANPENWIFFVELSKQTEMEAQNGVNIRKEEVGLFYRIAERLGIPVKNPLVSIDSDALIAKLESEGTSKVDLAVTMAMLHIHDEIYGNPKNKDYLDSLSPSEKAMVLLETIRSYFVSRKNQHPQIEKTAWKYGLDSKEFFEAAQALLQQPENADPAEFYENLLKKLGKVLRKAVQASNELSRPRVQDYIKDSNKSHAFIQMGSQHLPIVQNVYEESNEIPLEKIVKVTRAQ